MHTILDLDLDFFVDPIEHDMPDSGDRLPSEEYSVASESQVADLLEHRCSLDVQKPLPGREVVHHVDAFWTWKEWIAKGVLEAPFNVVHVDAHSDLGIGERGWKYLMSELLLRDVNDRSNPPEGADGLSSGSYLAFAAANRWIANLVHVYPAHMRIITDPDGVRAPGDYVRFYMRDFDFRTNLIELRHYPADEALYAIMKDGPPPSTHVEPPIPFTWFPENEFSGRTFTHMIVAQSPAFTPVTADLLLPLIRRYFSPT
jgi:hypothetical protein